MNSNIEWNEDFLNVMSIIGFALGLYNLQLNQKQTDNDTIFRQVQKNEEKLDTQNEVYLEKIIAQNEQIIQLLKGDK